MSVPAHAGEESFLRTFRPEFFLAGLGVLALPYYAIKAFRAVHGSLYMRVDFFLSGSKLMINEINTIPGSTATSHIIPLSGWIGGMENLVSVIISAALERHRRRQEKTGR